MRGATCHIRPFLSKILPTKALGQAQGYHVKSARASPSRRPDSGSPLNVRADHRTRRLELRRPTRASHHSALFAVPFSLVHQLYPPAFGRKHRARQFIVSLTITSNTLEDTTLARHIAHSTSSNRPGSPSPTTTKVVTANPPLRSAVARPATRHAARRSPLFSPSGNCIAHSTAPDTARSNLPLPFTFQARLHELHKSTSSQLFRKRLPVDADASSALHRARLPSARHQPTHLGFFTS